MSTPGSNKRFRYSKIPALYQKTTGKGRLLLRCLRNVFDGNDGAELQLSGEVWEALLHEGNRSFRDRVKGVVLADANAGSCMNFGSALADDDIAWANGRAVTTLDAETFRLGIAAVSCRSLGKFMCHMLEVLDRPR